MALAQGPLIDPDHDGRYLSPLRPDPRPLRGIMLAYHALAYIAALFTDVADIPQVTWAGLARELADTREKMGSAEATIAGARRHLTDWGRDFFDRTREVAAYASA